ncbi:MAG: TolC family protein [Holophagales bacterium]|nr:TolC family protein [Holophagales bacterium]
MSVKPLALALLLLPCAVAGAPPAEVPLTLADARLRALAKNIELRVERENATVAGSAETRAKGAYDPTLRADARWRDRTDPVNSILSGAPAGDLAPNSSGWAASFGLLQLLPTGGSVALTTSASRDETTNVFAILSPSWSTSVGLELRQPLLRGLAIDPSRQGLRVAILDRTRSAASVRRVATETIAAVERTYWSLLAARRDAEARESAVSLAQRQKSDVEARVEAGTLSEADLSSPVAELERRKGELYAAREVESRAENALKALLLSDPADPLWSSRIAPAEEVENVAFSPPDLGEALASATSLRPEVNEAAARLARLAVDDEAARDRTRPQLDLVAAYSRRGLSGERNPGISPPFPTGPIVVPDALEGGLGRSLGTIQEGRFPDASVGLALTVPLGNRAARADATAARAVRTQAELGLLRARQQVEVEIRNAAVTLETAGQRLAAARAGRSAAEDQLRAEEERFSAGLTTSFFVLTRQNDLTQALLAETASLADLRKAHVEWGRATGTLLSERQIEVQDDEPAAAPAGGTR